MWEWSSYGSIPLAWVSESASQWLSQAGSQPISQSANQPVSQSVSQPVSQSASQSVSQSVCRPVSQSASQPVTASKTASHSVENWVIRYNYIINYTIMILLTIITDLFSVLFWNLCFFVSQAGMKHFFFQISTSVDKVDLFLVKNIWFMSGSKSSSAKRNKLIKMPILPCILLIASPANIGHVVYPVMRSGV